jgi:hypothetical protein
MSEVIKWQGSAVDVRAQLVPRFLWNTASLDAFLDSRRILRTGGPLKFTGSQSAAFTHSGCPHTAEVHGGIGWWSSFPYQLKIDGTPVSASRAQIRNWPMGFVGGILVASALLAIVHLVHLVLRT